jgi:IS1 family transposase/DNA-directed RNA polymerase subunit RPC12/RpoP
MHCPCCQHAIIVKNGIQPNTNKQRYRCKGCGKQFVQEPAKQKIADSLIALIDRLLLERISLAGICRAVGVSRRWLQYYVNAKYAAVPRHIQFSGKSQGELVLECDELWSYVGKKKHKQWVWLALDKHSREIVGVYVGTRDSEGARALWDSIPLQYQQTAFTFTDFWQAYQAVFPDQRHLAVGKETGKTNHIERFNNTLRQRVSRLVRKSLSFSKKLDNHIGAIWYFIHHYNASLTLSI